MNPPPRRIALYGGSFDPVHPAHVAIAEAAVQQVGLDRVIFLPAAQSPLKDHGPVAAGPLRLQMLHAVLADCPWAEVSAWELTRPGPSWSWETVEHFRQSFPENVECFWVMGVDQWDQLPRWRRWEHLATLVTFLVFTRSGIAPQPREGVEAVFLTGEFTGSSTDIRTAVREGRGWEVMLHPDVAEIIRREELYSVGRH